MDLCPGCGNEKVRHGSKPSTSCDAGFYYKDGFLYFVEEPSDDGGIGEGWESWSAL